MFTPAIQISIRCECWVHLPGEHKDHSTARGAPVIGPDSKCGARSLQGHSREFQKVSGRTMKRTSPRLLVRANDLAFTASASLFLRPIGERTSIIVN